MIRFITSLIKAAFIIFLFAVLFVNAYFLINKKVQNIYYPDMFGYSYIKSEVDNEELNIKQDDYLFTKEIESVYKDDIIVYLDNTNVLYAKVIDIDKEKYICSDGLNNGSINVPKESYQAKLIYTNDTVSKVLNILMNPISIAVMILYCLFISQITYKRY